MASLLIANKTIYLSFFKFFGKDLNKYKFYFNAAYAISLSFYKFSDNDLNKLKFYFTAANATSLSFLKF